MLVDQLTEDLVSTDAPYLAGFDGTDA